VVTAEYYLVVCAIERDLPVLEIAIPYMWRFLSPRRIILIASSSCLDKFSTKYHDAEHKNDLCLVDEDKAAPGLTLNNVRALLAARGAAPARAGWYFQQFLKLCYSLNPKAGSHYLVWDADTIPLRPMEFFNHDGRTFFETSAEYNPAYFATMQRLIGIGKAEPYSFISEHMMIERNKAVQLLKEICGSSEVSCRQVAERIISAIDAESLSESGFSEFETYGTYVTSKYPESVAVRALPSQRQGVLIYGRQPKPQDLFALSRRYYWASFEAWPVTSVKTRVKRFAWSALGSVEAWAARRLDSHMYKEFLDITKKDEA
jgi:hypothetical protein